MAAKEPYGAALILATMLAALAYVRHRSSAGIESLAVLPIGGSAGPETEYLVDGITETIIANLSQIPDLRVMARSTVFRYKGLEVDAHKAGRDLGVRAVLAGTLARSGDKVVSATELVNASDGARIWGARYERKLSDILTVQDDIAREICDRLRRNMTGEEQKRRAPDSKAQRPLSNSQASSFGLSSFGFSNHGSLIYEIHFGSNRAWELTVVDVEAGKERKIAELRLPSSAIPRPSRVRAAKQRRSKSAAPRRRRKVLRSRHRRPQGCLLPSLPVLHQKSHCDRGVTK